jgi:putative acetyltransferase
MLKLLVVNIEITTEDSQTDEITQILQTHWFFCQSATPSEFSYSLNASQLFAPDITVFGARMNGELVGVGALRKLGDKHGELKSMHTLAKARGKGIGKAMVRHIEDFARAQGISRISLETGTHEPFKAARDLYSSLGYQECGAFGEYILSEYNTCMTKYL